MQVIVKFISGETKQGRLPVFNVNNPVLFLQVPGEAGKFVSTSVFMSDVQQIIYLKKESGGGSAVRREKIGNTILASATSFRLNVEFRDGSLLTGTTHRYNANEKGFYLIPLNPADKSERIFIPAHAVRRVEAVKLFGKVLVDQNKISQQQLEIAMLRQREAREKKLGAILRDEQMISDEQLKASLKKQKENSAFIGEILLHFNYITRAQLDYALRMQREYRKKRLGQILVELKFLSPNDICIALATQFNCAWIDLEDVIIPQQAAHSLPEEIVKRFEVIPVEKRDNAVLVVATSDPRNLESNREIASAAPCRVEFAVAYEVYITRQIALHFPAGGAP